MCSVLRMAYKATYDPANASLVSPISPLHPWLQFFTVTLFSSHTGLFNFLLASLTFHIMSYVWAFAKTTPRTLFFFSLFFVPCAQLTFYCLSDLSPYAIFLLKPYLPQFSSIESFNVLLITLCGGCLFTCWFPAMDWKLRGQGIVFHLQLYFWNLPSGDK